MPVQAEYISRRIAKGCCFRSCADANGLQKLASIRDYFLHCLWDIVDHDRDRKSRLGGRLAAGYPGPADFPQGVVRGDIPILANSEQPPEGFLVKEGRLFDIDRKDLQVTNLAISKTGVLLIFHTLLFKAKKVVWPETQLTKMGNHYAKLAIPE
jgi:hypothetical protein